MFGKFEDEVNLSKTRYISSLYPTAPVHLLTSSVLRTGAFYDAVRFLKILRQAICKCIKQI